MTQEQKKRVEIFTVTKRESSSAENTSIACLKTNQTKNFLFFYGNVLRFKGNEEQTAREYEKVEEEV